MSAAPTLLDSNRQLAAFLAKMVAAYAVWFVVYDLWLLPDGRLDAALSTTVASATGALFGLFRDDVVVSGRAVWTGDAAIQIVNGCNGLGALSLFVGFVLAYPGTWARRAVFVPAGLAVIALANVVRCIALLVVQGTWPSLFDAIHYAHAMLVFYVIIFGLWVLWAHVGEGPRRAAAA